MTEAANKARFSPGALAITTNALDTLTEAGVNPASFFYRHLCGDWGDISEHDRALNEEAIDTKDRIHSVYKHPVGDVWVITDADHGVTTILLPEDY